MIDLDAPIIPGESAAGLRIGQPQQQILALQPKRTEPLHNCIKYDFGAVAVWVARKKVSQIGLVKGYRGAFAMAPDVRVGCTLLALEALGEIDVDEDDNTVVSGLAGVVFDVTKASGKKSASGTRDHVRIRGIYVIA
jgi:hypothetical protein